MAGMAGFRSVGEVSAPTVQRFGGSFPVVRSYLVYAVTGRSDTCRASPERGARRGAETETERALGRGAGRPGCMLLLDHASQRGGLGPHAPAVPPSTAARRQLGTHPAPDVR